MPSFAKFGNDLYSGRRSLQFVSNRRRWYTIAAIAIGISLIGLFARGLNEGIEFKGGSQFTISSVSDTSQLTGQRAVTKVVPGADVRVSVVGTNSIRIQTNSMPSADIDKVQTSLASAYHVGVDRISYTFVGPSWGQDVSRKAITGLVVFLILVSAVITLYFRTWKMAVAGLVALLHDLLFTVGVYALVGFEVTPASVIGFLTILGYSLYDTVVVFDKVRENTDHITATTKRTFAEAANLAVNQTLVRSINTSVVALLPVGAILFIGAFLLGPGTLEDISLALFVGIGIGTYSSIFIATPLLVHLRESEPALRAQAERVRKKRAEAPRTAALAEGDDEVGVPVGSAATAAGTQPGGAAALGTGPGGTGAVVPGAAGGVVGAGAAGASGTSPRRPAQGASGTGGQRQQPRKSGPGRGRSGGRKR